eukprot:1382673-Pleurochrysis_carterae.AAC.1
MQNCASAIGVGVKGCIITFAQPMTKLGMLLKTRTELVPACVPFVLDASKNKGGKGSNAPAETVGGDGL